MHTPKGNLQLKLQPMDLNLLLQGQQLTRSLTFVQPCDILEFPSETELHVWGQQISCYQLYHPQLHHLQKTPFGILWLKGSDRIPSATPGAEPPRDVRDSGSARSHSTHLETSSSERP